MAVIDTDTVITASSDGTARVWDLNNPDQPTHTLTGHTGAVLSVAVIDTDTVITASDDDTARVWDLNNPDQPTHTIAAPAVSGVAHFGDDRVVIAASNGFVVARINR